MVSRDNPASNASRPSAFVACHQCRHMAVLAVLAVLAVAANGDRRLSAAVMSTMASACVATFCSQIGQQGLDGTHRPAFSI